MTEVFAMYEETLLEANEALNQHQEKTAQAINKGRKGKK